MAPLVLWRLSYAVHANNALDGEGARIVGGRWNRRGRRAVYLSEHLSAAILELLVHINLRRVPPLVAIRVEVPSGTAIYEPALADLPPDWRETPGPPDSTREFAEKWFAGGATALMRVPSVVVPEEFNYILNPDHASAGRLSVRAPEPFTLDRRLQRR